MGWRFEELRSLLALAEARLVSAAQLAGVARAFPLAPSRASWWFVADRLLLFAGVLLCVSGIVSFFAWNWEAMHRFFKFGLLAAAFTACVVAAAAVRAEGVVWRACMFAAGSLIGVLLAVVGQTYQTGADPWELFFSWAVLLLPLAFLARASETWALWWMIANLALLRAVDQSVWSPFGGLLQTSSLLLIAGFNAVLLLVFEAGRRFFWKGFCRTLPRLAALAMLAALSLGAGWGWWSDPISLFLPLFAVVCVAMLWFYRLRRIDVVILALVLTALIAVVTVGLIRAIPRSMDFLAFNLVGLFVVCSSAVAGAWLLRVLRGTRAIRPAVPPADGDPDSAAGKPAP